MTGFLLRWIFAFALLALTFNPTEYNYVQWVRSYGGMNVSIAVLAGLVLLVGYIIYLRATLRSIGALGMLLVTGLVGAALWVLYDLGVLRLDDPSMNVWLALAVLSFVLAIGLSWSIMRRALSGQADVDDVDV
jgi:Na+/melibiose symporter-like transporter